MKEVDDGSRELTPNQQRYLLAYDLVDIAMEAGSQGDYANANRMRQLAETAMQEAHDKNPLIKSLGE